jgi:cytochrome c5
MNKKEIVLLLALGAVLLAGVAGAGTGRAPDGERLVRERCSQCHPLDRVDQARKDRAGWEQTVDRMIGKREGLLDAVEREAVVEYLAGR